MSLPWEPPNIIPNLATLARLRRGDHLSVLKEGENTDGDTYTQGDRGLRALFKIQGKYKQSIVRSKKGESILEDDQYKGPLIRFFQAAADAWRRHQTDEDHVTAALQGLENLRQTYASDGARRAKMDDILASVRLELRGIKVEGVLLVPGERRVLLGTFPGMRQRILDLITDIKGSQPKVEYATGVQKDFIDAVYGKNAKPQQETFLPLGNFWYERKSTGVCTQFYLDGVDRDGIKLQGNPTRCDKVGLRQLYEFTGRDEGLLFTISQLATQASLSGTPNMLFMTGGRNGEQKVPLLRSCDQRIYFSMGGGNCDITKEGGQIVVSNDQQYDGNVDGFSTEGDHKPLSGFGITQIGIRLSVKLRRHGKTILLELHESTLRITTG